MPGLPFDAYAARGRSLLEVFSLLTSEARNMERTLGKKMIVHNMTAAQFDALSRLLRLRHGPARECARLVLVDGLRQVDAAAATGLSQQRACDAVRRVRIGLELAQEASGIAN